MWVITRDLINNNLRKGVCSPGFLEGTVLPFEFRLSDDDGKVYYRGWSDDSSSFGPLRFGQVTAGCTKIQYWENGEWAHL